MAKTIIKNRFATTPNELLNDKTISLKAKGLFAYIQSKPNDWDFSVERIANSLLEGIESIRNAVQELERNGYLTRQKVHLGQGKFDTDYILHITPQLVEKSDPLESDPLESRRVGFPPHENHPNNSNKEFSKKEEQIKREQTLANFENFWNLYDKKEDSKKCKDLFTNLPEQTQQKILQVAPLYVKKTPDKKFRKHPLTWLRGSCWEDDYSDIVKQTQESKPEPKLFYTNEDYEAALAKWNAKNATSNLHDI